MMIAEESTAWPGVTKPVSEGGLGFNFKWNMGWMNDVLDYVETDPVYRTGVHNNLTFAITYVYSENYVLPISHDEVVHGKYSLINKMPGDYDMKFAGWRNFLMYMYAHPGKKLNFMGSEFAQFIEWDYKKELDWFLLDYPAHAGAQKFTAALNEFYCSRPAMWARDTSISGFEWLVVDDVNQNVYVFARNDGAGDYVICVLNFSPCEYKNYSFGAPEGRYKEALCSDIGGWKRGRKIHRAENIPWHGMENRLTLDIKPMSGLYLVRDKEE